jgi:hypothetical protein
MLDKAPARLLITVRRDRLNNGKRDSASVHARTDNVSINKGGVLTSTGPLATRKDSAGSVSVELESQQWSEDRDIVQRVQVLEGREAYIAIGEEIPVRNHGVLVGPNGRYYHDSTEFYPAVTGVYAIARLKGNSVFLDISTTSRERTGRVKIRTGREYHGRQEQPVASAGLSTSVSGSLGEWIALGAVDQNSRSGQSGILTAEKQFAESVYGIYIKVDRVQERK